MIEKSAKIIGRCHTDDSAYYLIILNDQDVATSVTFSQDTIDNIKSYISLYVTDVKTHFGKRVSWIAPELIFKNKITVKCEGSLCKKCNDFARMAEPNREDGSFICYSCRSNQLWK